MAQKREKKAEKQRRHAFYESVLRKGGCWLRTLIPHECDGPMDPAHLLPKQRLRAIARDRYPDDEEMQWKMIWGPDNGVPICRAYHHRLDNGFVRIYWNQLPSEARKFAINWDIEWEMEQVFRKDHVDE